METKTSKGKEIRIPGPDHRITISPAEGKVPCNGSRQDSCRIDASASTRGEGISARLLRAPERDRHVAARLDHAPYLLSVQG
jgi:hypothetical protein